MTSYYQEAFHCTSARSISTRTCTRVNIITTEIARDYSIRDSTIELHGMQEKLLTGRPRGTSASLLLFILYYHTRKKEQIIFSGRLRCTSACRFRLFTIDLGKYSPKHFRRFFAFNQNEIVVMFIAGNYVNYVSKRYQSP